MTGQHNIFGGVDPITGGKIVRGQLRNKDGSHKSNPMIPVYGTTPGKRCKSCIYLVMKQYGKRYYKCRLRKNVNKSTPASDHRVNWEACGKFEE